MTTEPVTIHAHADVYTAQLTRGQAVTGPLIGGNFDTLSRSVGWALPDLTGAILLMEDHHGTGLGQIDRCFAQLIHSGSLDRLAGIAIGTFGEFETATASGTTLTDVMDHWLTRIGVAVLGGLRIGHGPQPATVPLGTATTINPHSQTLTAEPGTA